MSEEVSIRYVYTLAEMTEAARWHLRQGKMRPFFVFLWLLIVLAAGFAAVTAWRAARWPQMLYLPAALLYILLLPKLRPWLILWRMRRNFAKSSTRDMEIGWRITADRLHVSTPNSTSEMKWAVFNKAALTPVGVLLYPQPGIFHWLPRQSFVTEEDYAAVVAWARQHIAAFREVK